MYHKRWPYGACIYLVFKKLVVSIIVVVFIIVVFVMVIFVIAHCRNMHNIAPHGATAAEAFISSSAFVQEGSREASWLYLFFQGKEWLRL